MPSKKPTTMYRSLFRDALRVAWERKALWVFGLFAALLSTGGVCETAAKGVRQLTVTRDVYVSMLNGTFTGTELFGRYVRDAIELDPSRLTILATTFVLFGAAAIVASVVSQGALIEGVGRKAIPDAQAAAAGRSSFWHLLGLNVLNKAAQLLIILLSALPMFLLVARADGASAAWAMFAFLIAFPLTIVVSVLFMLASVHAVRTGSHSLDAIHHALSQFRAHWLAAFETGLLLFGAALVAALGFVATVAVVSIPFAILIFVSLLMGSYFLLLTVNVLGAAALILMIFAFAGATTAFQYAVWTRFYDHANARRTIISKIQRVWRGR